MKGANACTKFCIVEGPQRFHVRVRHRSPVWMAQPGTPGDAGPDVDVDRTPEARQGVVGWRHHFTRALQGDGHHGGFWDGGRQTGHACFRFQQERGFGALGTRAFREDPDRPSSAKQGHGTLEGILCTALTVGFDLPCRAHQPSAWPGLKVTVLGEVVGLPSGGHDHHDGVHVRKVVRGQDDRSTSWDVVQATHAQPHEEPHGWVHHDPDSTVVRVPKFHSLRLVDAAAESDVAPWVRCFCAHGMTRSGGVKKLQAEGVHHDLLRLHEPFAKAQDGPCRRVVMRGAVVGLLLCLVVLPVHAPFVAAETWEEDGWLRTPLAEERLEAGDEFGCAGFPGLSWANDPGAVASACRAYLGERTNASRWGDAPLSIGTPRGLTASDHTTLGGLGFTVHGDDLGLSNGAWHDAEDVPLVEEDWYDLGRRGGSLERDVADLEGLRSALDEGGVVNLYWVGRVGDISIRHDADVVDMLLERDDVWFTTWGEAWSTWAIGRCHEFSLEVVDERRVGFTLLDTDACRGANPEVWRVPTTWRVSLPSHVGVDAVLVDGTPAVDLSTERNTAVGWRIDEGDLLLSLSVGQRMEVLVNSDVNRSDLDVIEMTPQWNGRSVAVTVAGHDTTDLQRWSRRFLEVEDLRFTWLVSPRVADPDMPWLPWVGVLAGAATVAGMRYVISRDDGTSAIVKPGQGHARDAEE